MDEVSKHVQSFLLRTPLLPDILTFNDYYVSYGSGIVRQLSENTRVGLDERLEQKTKNDDVGMDL